MAALQEFHWIMGRSAGRANQDILKMIIHMLDLVCIEGQGALSSSNLIRGRALARLRYPVPIPINNHESN